MYPALLPIAYMVLSYGLRRSEVLGLRWDMIDFKRKIIHISRTITKVDTQLENDLTKTPAGNRECEFLPNTEEMLRLLESTPITHQGGCKSPHGAADICDYVFRKPDGTPYRLDYISHAFKKIAIAYGRPDLTLHKLRHSCASILHDLGWNVKKAAAWLGHADCSVTLEIYTHIEQLRTDEELMALNARLPSFSSLMSCTIDTENKACENNFRPVGK
jgi:integrase